MKGSKGIANKNPLSKKALPGAAKGGGTSGGSMKGGMSAIPKAPGSNNSSKPR